MVLLLRGRLTRRIGAAVFLSILVIETVILIPSYFSYERDLLVRLEHEGQATVRSLFTTGRHSDLAMLKRTAVQVMEESRVLGGAFYPTYGDPPVLFGEAPKLAPHKPSEPWVVRKRSADGNRYDVAWPSEFGSFYSVVARLDASWIAGELAAFVWRVLGLVLLISSFVTVVTMVIVGRLVIGPVLRLRQSVVAAAADPGHPDRHAVDVAQDDELGEVMHAFNKMLADVASTQRQEIARMVAMTENSIAGIFAYDADGQLVYCNKAALDLCSAGNPSGLRNESHPKVVPAGEKNPVTLVDYLRRGPCAEELMLEVVSGKVLPCLVSGGDVRDDDGATSLFFASVLDVTDMHAYRDRLEKQNIRLEAASRAKSDFLANMSHELRTPLNAIIGFSEVMTARLFGPLGDDKYTQYVEDIHASGVHLLSIISDMLDLSKIEADKAELYEQPVDLDDVIDSSLRIVAERAESGLVKLEADIAPNLPTLCADKRLIKQILLNLLSNAIKFTPEDGEVTLRVARDGDGVAIAVIDTGIGMDDEEIEKALSPFGQVESALTRQHEGTGLGLPLVKSFAELHGATVAVDSTKGVGTTVTVRFGADRILRPDAMCRAAKQPEIARAG